ncbi:MAG: hypothetical protein ACJ763_15305 [Bdellovibrionia bacterium]
MKKPVRNLLTLFAATLSSTGWAFQAQPVPVPEDQSTAPQIDIAAVGTATLNLGRTGSTGKTEGGINFSDSAVQLGGAERLFNQGIGSAVFGGMTNEESIQGGGNSLFLHQTLVDYQEQSFEALLGRSDNPTAHLIDFPTLRGDDLITLTNPLDPFSNGTNVEEHRYSNVASVTFNQKLRYFENFHAQHLINSAGLGSPSGLNSFGATFEYRVDVGQEMFQRVPYWGVGYEHITLANNSPGGLNQAYAGMVLNLNESVTNRWDLRLQDIVSLGSDLRSFANITDSFQGNSNAISGSIRYLHSPFGSAGYQLALTLGQKKYFRVSNASSWGGALTGVKTLGQGFDVVVQYQGQWRGQALASAQSSGIAYEQVAEAGLMFNFDAVINQHLSPRRSILNQQHQYIPR